MYMRILSFILLGVLVIPLYSEVNKEYKVFYGNIHSHTSEGGDDNHQQATYKTAFDFARKRGKLDFFTVSPHSHMINDEEYQRLREFSNGYSANAMVPLFGTEWGVIAKTGHIGIYNADHLCPVDPDKIPTALQLQNGDFQGDASTVQQSVDDVYKWLYKQNGKVFGVFNHPEVFHYGFFYSPIADERIRLAEIWNGPFTATRIDLMGRPLDYYQRYGELLQRGWHVGAVANQDNHMKTWGVATLARTGVLSKTKDREGILDALWNRRTYAVTDTNMKLWFFAKASHFKSSYPMGSMLYRLDKVNFDCVVEDPDEDIESIELIYGVIGSGKPLETICKVAGNRLEFQAEVSPQEAFYYVVVKQADGGTAVSSPIWATQLSKFECLLNRYYRNDRTIEYMKLHQKYLKDADEYKREQNERIVTLEKIKSRFEELITAELIKDNNIDENNLRRFSRYVKTMLDARLNVMEIKFFKEILKNIEVNFTLNDEQKKHLQAIQGYDYSQTFLDAYDALSEDELSELAISSGKIKDYDRSVIIVNKLKERFAGSDKMPKYLMALAKVYKELHIQLMAIRVCEEVINSFPEYENEARYFISNMYKTQGNTGPKLEKTDWYKKSLKELETILKSDTQDAFYQSASKSYGDVCLSMTKLDEENQDKYFDMAVNHFEQSLSQTDDPKYKMTYLSKIGAIYENKSYKNYNTEKAVEIYTKCIEDYAGEQTVFGFHINIAKAKMSIAKTVEDVEKAKKIYTKALMNYTMFLEKGGKLSGALIYPMADCYEKIGQLGQSETMFTDFIKKYPRDLKYEDALYKLATVIEQQKKIEKAIEKYQYLLDNHPNYKLCYLNHDHQEVSGEESIIGHKIKELNEILNSGKNSNEIDVSDLTGSVEPDDFEGVERKYDTNSKLNDKRFRENHGAYPTQE